MTCEINCLFLKDWSHGNNPEQEKNPWFPLTVGEQNGKVHVSCGLNYWYFIWEGCFNRKVVYRKVIYRNFGKNVGHTWFCLSAVKSLSTGYAFREMCCVWSSSESNDWFCLRFSPLRHSTFLCSSFLVSLFICYHAHSCELVCDNWCRKKTDVSIAISGRPEPCKKPQEQVRETLREV